MSGRYPESPDDKDPRQRDTQKPRHKSLTEAARARLGKPNFAVADSPSRREMPRDPNPAALDRFPEVYHLAALPPPTKDVAEQTSVIRTQLGVENPEESLGTNK